MLNNTVKIDNEILSRPLNSRIQARCESIDLQHEHFIHIEVRCLSKGQVVSHLVELKEETKQFLRERNTPLAVFLLDEMWMSKLAYLVGIFCHLNKLNTGALLKYLSIEK